MYNYKWGERYEIEGIGPGSDPFHFSCQLCEGNFPVDRGFVHRHVCQASHNKKRVEVFEEEKTKMLNLLEEGAGLFQEELLRIATVARANPVLQKWALDDLLWTKAVEAYQEDGAKEIWLEKVWRSQTPMLLCQLPTDNP